MHNIESIAKQVVMFLIEQRALHQAEFQNVGTMSLSLLLISFLETVQFLLRSEKTQTIQHTDTKKIEKGLKTMLIIKQQQTTLIKTKW